MCRDPISSRIQVSIRTPVRARAPSRYPSQPIESALSRCAVSESWIPECRAVPRVFRAWQLRTTIQPVSRRRDVRVPPGSADRPALFAVRTAGVPRMPDPGQCRLSVPGMRCGGPGQPTRAADSHRFARRSEADRHLCADRHQRAGLPDRRHSGQIRRERGPIVHLPGRVPGAVAGGGRPVVALDHQRVPPRLGHPYRAEHAVAVHPRRCSGTDARPRQVSHRLSARA